MWVSSNQHRPLLEIVWCFRTCLISSTEVDCRDFAVYGCCRGLKQERERDRERATLLKLNNHNRCRIHAPVNDTQDGFHEPVLPEICRERRQILIASKRATCCRNRYLHDTFYSLIAKGGLRHFYQITPENQLLNLNYSTIKSFSLFTNSVCPL